MMCGISSLGLAVALTKYTNECDEYRGHVCQWARFIPKEKRWVSVKISCDCPNYTDAVPSLIQVTNDTHS